MNVLALISAIIGIAIVIWSVNYRKNIENKILKSSAIAIGLLVSLIVASNAPSILGDPRIETVEKVGEYYLYLGIISIIIKSIFFRKKPQK